jgi:NAD(P)-dependent dehydrogenase (short-subunit alcohol dehydrogenase family)
VQVKVDFPKADIRVNEIAPGFLDTTQNHRLLFEEDDKTLTPRGRSIIANTPFGRFGDPQELLGPIVLLISDAGSFLHGVTIPVDGGFAIYSGVGPLDEKR